MTASLHPHILCEVGDVSPYLLLVEDVELANRCAQLLSEARKVSEKGQFVVYTGKYKTVPVSIMSTGIGAPATAIAVEECIRLGARIIIGVNTACALQPRLSLGDIILPLAAIRDDGVSRLYMPPEYPAIPCFGIVKVIADVLEANGAKYHMGVVWTTDLYYMDVVESEIKKWKKQDVLAVDLTTAALYVVSNYRKVRSAAILVVDSSLAKGIPRGELEASEEKAELAEDVQDKLVTAATAALEAMRILHEKAKAEVVAAEKKP